MDRHQSVRLRILLDAASVINYTHVAPCSCGVQGTRQNLCGKLALCCYLVTSMIRIVQVSESEYVRFVLYLSKTLIFVKLSCSLVS